MESDHELLLLTVDVQIYRDGTPLALTHLRRTGTTFTYTIKLESFDAGDSGNYTCTATVRPQSTTAYLTESDVLSSTECIKAG